MGVMAAAALDVFGSDCRYTRFSEAVPVVARGHAAFWQSAGRAPAWTVRAESVQREPRAEVELVSLRCTPYTWLNRDYPKGTWAGLAELAAVADGWAKRGVVGVIIENTGAIWDRELEGQSLRSWYEDCLPTEYLWRAFRTRATRHEEHNVNSDRVFYVGARRRAKRQASRAPPPSAPPSSTSASRGRRSSTNSATSTFSSARRF